MMRASHKIRQTILGVQICVLLGGCQMLTLNHAKLWLTPDDGFVITRQTQFALQKQSVYYVGRLASDAMPDEQEALYETFSAELSAYGLQVAKTGEPETLDQMRASAIANGAHFVVVPKLLRWRDKKDHWQEVWQDRNLLQVGRDSLELGIMLYEVSSWYLVDHVRISAKSGWAVSWNRKPNELLKLPVHSLMNLWFPPQ